MAEEELADYWASLIPPSNGGRGCAAPIRGRKFGRLRVMERDGSSAKGESLWRCNCECGTIKVIRRSRLTSGKIKSCGCLLLEYQSSRKAHLKRCI